MLTGNPCVGGSYQNLTDGDRSVNFTDNTKLKVNCDDVNITNWDVWYRVSGDAGNALASSIVPPPDSCGTETRMYLAGDHPDFGDGVVTKKICVTKSPENPCRNSGEEHIQVINCGSFYLYKLIHMRRCTQTTWAYCTNGQGMYHRFFYGVCYSHLIIENYKPYSKKRERAASEACFLKV